MYGVAHQGLEDPGMVSSCVISWASSRSYDGAYWDVFLVNFRLSEEPGALGVGWSELSVQGFGDIARMWERAKFAL